MTTYEEELAALMALDALELDEQADAELRLGTFPPGLSATSAALAEVTAATPPTDLRGQTLQRALDRRPAGQVSGGVSPCTPADGFVRTISDFHALLRTLTRAEWDAQAHPEHGRVRELVAHLIGIERISVRWLQADPDLPTLPDHVAATRVTVEDLADIDPMRLPALWHEAATAVVAAAADGDPRRPVTFHDLTLTLDGYAVTRTFELWAHAMDIAAATDRPLLALDPERMALMSQRLMAVVPYALAYRRSTAVGRAARFVLTGPSGGCYTVALSPGEEPGEPDVVVVADAVDLCRVAARRLRPEELVASIDGDRELADLVLAGIDAFARD